MVDIVVLMVLMLSVQNVHGVTLQTPPRLVAAVGSRVNLLCEIKYRSDESSYSFTADDITWYLSDTKLPPDVYSAANDTTSELSLTRVEVQDSGNYSCVLGSLLKENATVAITLLEVGTDPDLTNFSCVCYNMGEMWCTWDPIDSHLETTYEFTWRLHFKPEWKPCPDKTEKGPNSCFFEFYKNLGSLHRMRVTATNALGQTSKEIWFNPDTETIPHPPENIRVIPKTAYTLEVKWDPPGDWYFSDTFFLQYKLEYQSEWEPGKWSKIRKIDRQERYRIRNLVPYTMYTIRVSCKPTGTDGYWSDWSELASRRTQSAAPDEGVKLFISGETVKNRMRDVTLTWTLPERRRRNGIIQGFNITWREEGNTKNVQEMNIPDGNQSMVIIKDLDLYRSYQVSMTAYNSVGSSPATVIRILDKSTMPGAPQITEVKAISNSSISVSWEEPKNPNGIITGYVLAYMASDGTVGSAQTWTRLEFESNIYHHVAKDLQEYVQYDFKVQARNTVGYGGVSETVTEYTLEGAPTSAPVNLTLQAIPRTPSSLRASWKAPCLEDRNGVIRYYKLSYCTYYPSANGDSSNQRLGCQAKDVTKVTYTVSDPHALKSTRESLHYEITGLKAYTQYAVSVSAMTAAGEGPATEFVLQKTSIGAPRGRPVVVKVSKMKSSQLSLIWDMENDSDVTISHYVVGVRPLNHTDCGMKFMEVNATMATIPNLCGYETYEITVKACSGALIEDPCSKDSLPTYSTTMSGAPSKPMDMKALQVTDSTIEVVWQPPERLNSPENGLTYAVQCLTERNKSMTETIIVKSTNAVIPAQCDKSIDRKGVNVRCQVTAISDSQDHSPVVSTTYVQICYDNRVWPYVIIVISVILALGLVILSLYKCYKCAKRYGAFEKVSYIQPIWEVKVPMQVNVYFGEKEEYDEMYRHQKTVESQEKRTADSISIHSSDPGVVVDSVRPLLVVTSQCFSVSDQGCGRGGERKSKRPKSLGDEPSVEDLVLRDISLNEDQSRNRLSSADEYQMVAEVDGHNVLHPSGSLSSETSGEKEDYSELFDADGHVGLKAKDISKDDAEIIKKSGLEGKALEPNFLVPLQDGIPFVLDPDITSLSVFHADVSTGNPRLATVGLSRTIVRGNTDHNRQQGGELDADSRSSVPPLPLPFSGSDASLSRDGSGSATKQSETEDYQPMPGQGDRNVDDETGICTSGNTEESGIICDMSDSEDLENTVPLLIGIPCPVELASPGFTDPTAEVPTSTTNDTVGLQKFPVDSDNSFFLLQDNDSDQEEPEFPSEIEHIVSPQTALDDRYVPNSCACHGNHPSDLRQTTV